MDTEKVIVVFKHVIQIYGKLLTVYRHHYLKDIVDHFVIVESLISFRRSTFHLDTYKKWIDPIRHKISEVRIETIPGVEDRVASTGRECSDCWLREQYTRSAGRKAALAAVNEVDPFIFLSCDADEMPKLTAIQFLKEHYEEWTDEPVTLQTAYFWYNFQWVITNYQWGGAIAVTDKAIRGSDVELDFFRTKTHKRRTLFNSGYHCSWCMSLEDIQLKINSFSHQEVNKPEFNNLDVIKQNIATGKHMGPSANGYIPGKYDGE